MVDFETPEDKQLCDDLVYKAELMKQRPFRRWNADFGMIATLGGVIIVPILLGILLGGWLDEILPQRFSWRLSLLFVGFTWGMFNAYWWVKIEEAKIANLENENIKKHGEKK